MKRKNLLMFCGWLRSQRSYEELIKIAPADYNLYVLSYEELMPNGQIDKFQENVINFLKNNNLETVSIVGHSLGGALALECTYHNPDKVNQLFLVDSEGIYGHENLLQLARNFIRSNLSRQGSCNMKHVADLSRIFKKPLLHLKLAHFAHHANLQEEAISIKVPTMILWGEKDQLTPLWQGQKLHQLIENSKLIVLKDMDHDWILHSPELFWKNIKD